MTTSTERQQKRRARLRQQGYVDVTVPVPRKYAKTVRLYAKNLSAGVDVPINRSRLFKAIGAIKSIQIELKDLGINHVGIFGSTARGEDSPESDIDILIDIDVNRIGDILDYIDITEHIKKVINDYCSDVGVDIADYASLKSKIKANAEQDVIYAF
jgi:uncharacterized protein